MFRSSTSLANHYLTAYCGVGLGNMEVDYTNYSLSELLEVRENIDKEAYPERIEQIEKQITLRFKKRRYRRYEGANLLKGAGGT